jgi:hypothetical protein
MKEAVTIRLETDAKKRLTELAEAEGRTVSSMIDGAVHEFLERRLGRREADPPKVLKVHHANLPDTCVLNAFCTLVPEQAERARQDLGMPGLEFVKDRPEWIRLPLDLLEGDSDIVESVNLCPIYFNGKKGGSSLRLDWVGPCLEMFVGHCVFVRCDLASTYLTEADISDFEAFRGRARTGRDLSLRSLTAWARQSGSEMQSRGLKLQALWRDAIVGCQLGTDYHIAVRRVSPMLAILGDNDGEKITAEDPLISGITDLDRGFKEFSNGTVSAFSGNLLHSAELLTDGKKIALLLAGPADMRVPSLNALAGQKGMFATSSNGMVPMGSSVLAFWGEAVGWFRDQVINSESNELLEKFINTMFPGFADQQDSTQNLVRLTVLKSLMQTWVKWFASPEDARDFMGGKTFTENLAQHYTDLCDLLNPATQMKAPEQDTPSERQLWRFPVLLDSPAINLQAGDALASTSGPTK